ncbi:MAG: S28 family serine protease, partial [Saprospiraceae bacterium]|nr:S28 family serine protease [Saprospiraceae bacterium]
MKIFSLSALLMMLISLSAQKDPVIKCIQNKIEGVASIEVLGDEEGFEKVYDIRLNQPVDHNNPEAGEFQQRIYLYHKDYKKPVIFVTEGYDIKDRKYELTDILDANQISVEYRFFGESAPDTLQWEYLTNKQAAEDLHRIRDMFGRIYKEEWVSTGISKGGTTTMMYKALYPGDVDASVNYVGPLPLA